MAPLTERPAAAFALCDASVSGALVVFYDPAFGRLANLNAADPTAASPQHNELHLKSLITPFCPLSDIDKVYQPLRVGFHSDPSVVYTLTTSPMLSAASNSTTQSGSANNGPLLMCHFVLESTTVSVAPAPAPEPARLMPTFQGAFTADAPVLSHSVTDSFVASLTETLTSGPTTSNAASSEPSLNPSSRPLGSLVTSCAADVHPVQDAIVWSSSSSTRTLRTASAASCPFPAQTSGSHHAIDGSMHVSNRYASTAANVHSALTESLGAPSAVHRLSPPSRTSLEYQDRTRSSSCTWKVCSSTGSPTHSAGDFFSLRHGSESPPHQEWASAADLSHAQARAALSQSALEPMLGNSLEHVEKEVRGQFLANMSHELRTPLNGIIAIMELLRQSKLAPEQVELADTALESARLLLHILGNILDFSQADAGLLELAYEPLSVREVVEDAIDVVWPMAHDKRLVLSHLLPDELSGVVVMGDALRLRKILVHLLSNGVKFTDSGSIDLAVEVGEVSAAGEVSLLFKITDTGPGIPEAFRTAMFAAFRQASASRTRCHDGLGLGLAISAHLADLMNGRVVVESCSDGGTTAVLEVKLPLAREQISKASNTASGSPRDRARPLDSHKSADCLPAAARRDAAARATSTMSAVVAVKHTGLREQLIAYCRLARMHVDVMEEVPHYNTCIAQQQDDNPESSTDDDCKGSTVPVLITAAEDVAAALRQGWRRQPIISICFHDPMPAALRVHASPLHLPVKAVAFQRALVSVQSVVSSDLSLLKSLGLPFPLLDPPKTPATRDFERCYPGHHCGGCLSCRAHARSTAAAPSRASLDNSMLETAQRLSFAAKHRKESLSTVREEPVGAQPSAEGAPSPPLECAADCDPRAQGNSGTQLSSCADEALSCWLDCDVAAAKLARSAAGAPPFLCGPSSQAVPARSSARQSSDSDSSSCARPGASRAHTAASSSRPSQSSSRASPHDSSFLSTSDSSACSPNSAPSPSGSGESHATQATTRSSLAHSAAADGAAVLSSPLKFAWSSVRPAQSTGNPQDCASTPGGGCTLTSRPLQSEPDCGSVASAAEAPRQAKMRILIAEDNKINQLVVTKVLRSVLPDCEIEVVGDGLAATQAILGNSSREFDLVLMDIHMPRMDGYEATRRVREALPDGPRIIALTADTLAGVPDRCKDAGMNDCIVKPFNMTDMHRILTNRGPSRV